MRQSLRARLTLITTALFSFAVLSGAILVLFLQRYALTRVLDSSAAKTARDVATQVTDNPGATTVTPTTGGITAIQVLGPDNVPVAASRGTDRRVSLITATQLRQVRGGVRIDVGEFNSRSRLRVIGQPVGPDTVVVLTDLTRVDDSVRVLARAAIIGGPLAVLLMGIVTYVVVSSTLRPVAALRHGAADITAAGLAKQRLPVPGPQDEIHRLATTLNAMLDRIDIATTRQRTFVGDAAHELRSPLASLRVQLEVSRRLGPAADWPGVIDDVMVDMDRLERLMEDLLALARLDESGGSTHREPVEVGALAESVGDGYGHARVPVRVRGHRTSAWVDGDPDALRRVLINLINNASRYATSAVTVSVERHDGRVRMTIDDDGPGLPEDERERVFDRFYRVQESRSRESGGTGLGLPIVRDIVRHHGGRVWLTEHPDGSPGMRAVVDLPAASSSAR